MEFANKNIIVAGGSSGIGRTTAIELSKAGANVILIGRSEAKLNNVLTSDLASGNHSVFAFDFEQTENVKDLVQSISSKYDHIDGFVYSVGIAKRVRFNSLTTDVLNSVMKVNFYSFVEMLRNLVSAKKKDQTLKVVAISSLASNENTKLFLPYAASKNALESSIRILANELKSKNVFISGIKPAYVDTPFVAPNNDIYGDFNQYLKDGYQPLGLIPTKVVSDAVFMLLGNNANFYTGSCISIPAGVSC